MADEPKPIYQPPKPPISKDAKGRELVDGDIVLVPMMVSGSAHDPHGLPLVSCHHHGDGSSRTTVYMPARVVFRAREGDVNTVSEMSGG